MIRGRSHTLQSIDELLVALEHIEESELQSDIPANVRAELKRMKRNITAVLSFLSHSPLLREETRPELSQAMSELRRECLLVNSAITRALLMLTLRVRPAKLAEHTARAMRKYLELMWAAHGVCLLTVPQQAQALLNAL